MRSKVKITIEAVSVSAVALAAIIAVAVIMATSFTAWKSDFDATTAGNVKPPKQVLQSIDVALADGKVYYDNNLATVMSGDIVVTGHYKLGDDMLDEAIDSSECDISVPADFVSNGGVVTVTYKGKKATLEVTLVPVALDRVEIAQSPYTVSYKTGAIFSDNGLKAYAVYNDGSRKLLTTADYTVDIVTPLTVSDKSRTVTFTDGGITKTAEIAVNVSDNFSDGAVKSISAADDCYAAVGMDITDVVPSLKITYESGNSKLVGNDYIISNSSEIIRLGKAYKLKVRYKGNQRLSAEIPVIVRNHVEAENTVIVGGAKKTEASYTFEGGKFIKGENVTFAGGFSNNVNKGNEGSFATVIQSYADCTASITMRCGNSYAIRDDNGYFWMKPLQINSILDLTVNGNAVAIGNNVILKGCGPSEGNGGATADYAPLFGVYYEFAFDNVPLSAGNNTVKFEFKLSTLNEKNTWNETLSTMNVDWFNVDAVGADVAANATLEAVEIGEVSADYGDTVENAISSVTVLGRMSDGNRILLDSELFDITLVAGDLDDGTLSLGTYKFKAALKTDATVSTEREITIEYYECLVRKAELILENDRVWWVFTFDNIGYTAEDYEFFDGNVTFEAVGEFGKNTATFKIDVTEFEVVSTAYYPHLRIAGSNYANGTNSNGDVFSSVIQFTNGQTVKLGNKTYKLNKEYSMPTLVITETN